MIQEVHQDSNLLLGPNIQALCATVACCQDPPRLLLHTVAVEEPGNGVIPKITKSLHEDHIQ